MPRLKISRWWRRGVEVRGGLSSKALIWAILVFEVILLVVGVVVYYWAKTSFCCFHVMCFAAQILWEGAASCLAEMSLY